MRLNEIYIPPKPKTMWAQPVKSVVGYLDSTRMQRPADEPLVMSRLDKYGIPANLAKPFVRNTPLAAIVRYDLPAVVTTYRGARYRELAKGLEGYKTNDICVLVMFDSEPEAILVKDPARVGVALFRGDYAPTHWGGYRSREPAREPRLSYMTGVSYRTGSQDDDHDAGMAELFDKARKDHKNVTLRLVSYDRKNASRVMKGKFDISPTRLRHTKSELEAMRKDQIKADKKKEVMTSGKVITRDQAIALAPKAFGAFESALTKVQKLRPIRRGPYHSYSYRNVGRSGDAISRLIGATVKDVHRALEAVGPEVTAAMRDAVSKMVTYDAVTEKLFTHDQISMAQKTTVISKLDTAFPPEAAAPGEHRDLGWAYQQLPEVFRSRLDKILRKYDRDRVAKLGISSGGYALKCFLTTGYWPQLPPGMAKEFHDVVAQLTPVRSTDIRQQSVNLSPRQKAEAVMRLENMARLEQERQAPKVDDRPRNPPRRPGTRGSLLKR